MAEFTLGQTIPSELLDARGGEGEEEQVKIVEEKTTELVDDTETALKRMQRWGSN